MCFWRFSGVSLAVLNYPWPTRLILLKSERPLTWYQPYLCLQKRLLVVESVSLWFERSRSRLDENGGDFAIAIVKRTGLTLLRTSASPTFILRYSFFAYHTALIVVVSTSKRSIGLTTEWSYFCAVHWPSQRLASGTTVIEGRRAAPSLHVFWAP